jgi:hypothetical protein
VDDGLSGQRPAVKPGGDEKQSGPAGRSIKNCESLPALLLHHFKVLRRFGESFLAMKHARGKIEDCSPTTCRLRRVGIIVVASRV